MVIRLLPLLLLLACEGDPCARGSMLDSPGGLLVTPETHPTGWGFAECEACHALPALHRSGCTPEIDLDAVREHVETEGVAGCVDCHGDNGVAP